MALYTLKTREQALSPLANYNGDSQFVRNQMASFGYGPSADQTQLYNAIGRDSGTSTGGSDDNFFVKRGRSIENALGTTGAVLKETGGDLLGAAWAGLTDGDYVSNESKIQNAKIDNTLRENQDRMNSIYNEFGYKDSNDYYDAKNATEKEIFSKYGFDPDEYWSKRGNLWTPAGTNADAVKELDDARNNVINSMSAEDAEKIRYFDNIQNRLINQASENADKMNKLGDEYRDYRENNYVSKKINQDRGKFAGSAINTLSTAADLTGLTANPIANAVQGGIEGLADELEQNGFENFDWGRAGQNALVGSATGAVTGALNKGISNSLAKNGGNLFKGNNALTRGLNKAGSSTALGRGISTIATGAGRGAISGAVGGATGAGLSSAINGVEIGQGFQNALQGAVRGAQAGAASGAAMAGANMAISKTPGVGKFYNQLQNVKKNWDESGDSFKERWANTTASGDSPVANRFLGGNQRSDVYEALLNELKSDAYTNDDLAALMQSTDSDEAKILISKALEERSVPVAEASATDSSLGDRIKSNLRSPDSRTGNVLKNMPGKIGDKYNDWIAEPAEVEEFGPRYSQFSGDAEAARDYLIRRQQGEVPRAAYNQSLQDKNGDGFVDYVYGKPGEGEDYAGGYGLSHIQAKHGDEALSRVPYNTANGAVEKSLNDRIYLENGDNNDRAVIRTNWNDDDNGTIKKQWLATNYDKNNPASKGATVSSSSTAGSSVVSDTGDAPVNRIITQDDAIVNDENPQTRVYNALSDEQDTTVVPSKTSKEGKLRYAQGKELLAQYGAVDQPTARSSRAVQSIQEIADAGFTKPEDVERMANVITGSNGEVSKLTKNMIKNASPINTFAGEGDETISEYVENRVRLNSLSGTNKGNAVMETIKANLNSLPSRSPNSDVYEDSPEDVFKVIQNLEASAAELEGRGGNTYHRPTIENIHQAGVLKDTASLLKNRLFDTVDVSEALTPEVAQNLKSYAPNNEKFANWVDTEIMGAKNVQDLRKAQAPWVRMTKYIDNAYTQAATVGGRMASSVSDLSKVLTGKKNLISSVADTAWNSNAAHRARAAVYNKLADRAAAKETANANTPIQTDIPTTNVAATDASTNTPFNPATQIYNALGRTQGEMSGNQTREQLQDAAAGYVEPLGVTTPSYGANTLEGLTNTGDASVYSTFAGAQSSTPTYNLGVQTGYFQPTGDYWTDILAAATSSAIEDNDLAAFETLYDMYQSALSKNSSSASKDYSNPINWSSSDRSKLISAQDALGQIDQLEDAYNAATGGQGSNNLKGWFRSRAADISGGNWDPSAANYNSLAESIGMAIVKNLINLGVTEADAERYRKYIPSLTDTKKQAATKLETLRGIYQNQINNLYSIYGA